ncbi:MurR/RpiR family transcriptional regulator [Enterococcus rivorum]|uniref:RpiR family transcriptional regulator n=2 Tax=Enterococcus rivorum TaxID=762845 RepID=A0A1E5L0P5_9ENTE|nr:MurR/RpiR family transcriptional regulator [Enterococcus rivorum]MBP2098510.1 DNA-binding MurR/RpiR family transcriptional regulator [Enterococcus rivorum]OEH83641.1 RpiR family transcriptional regulator [Enterococcus rivorum]
MNSLYKKLHYKMEELSPIEKSILKYCLRNIEEVSAMTAEELAKETFTSQATISRMAKKLGFKGFQEFKFAIKSYDKQEKSYVTTGYSIDFEQRIKNMVKQISTSLSSLSEVQINEIAFLIAQSENIEFFGVGGSMPICLAAARKLSFLGKKANARIDWDELTVMANNLTSDDLAVVVSHSGETVGILSYASKLIKKKVPIVAIVGAPNSTLESMADYTLFAEMTAVYYDDVDLSSRISLSGLLDILLMQYAEKYYEKLE